MDFTKIKEYIIEHKKYVFIGVVIVIAFFLFKQQNDRPEVDNSKMFESSQQETQKESNFKKTTSEGGTENSTSSEKSTTVTCDITGAVKHEGVYTLKNGARIQELIEAAGGLKTNAQLKVINRAIMLKDQDKIHIPYKGEKVTTSEASVNTATSANSESASQSTNSSSSGSGDKINLNTATVADLQKLNGIGEKKAEKIIEYRKQKGEFKKIEDLMQVSGIGEKTFAALKDQLAL